MLECSVFITLDDEPVRASQELREGQRILIVDRMGLREMEVKLLRIPDRQVQRKQVNEYATVTRRQREPLDGSDIAMTPEPNE